MRNIQLRIDAENASKSKKNLRLSAFICGKNKFIILEQLGITFTHLLNSF